jgi:hypothetical protein
MWRLFSRTSSGKKWKNATSRSKDSNFGVIPKAKARKKKFSRNPGLVFENLRKKGRASGKNTLPFNISLTSKTICGRLAPPFRRARQVEVEVDFHAT